MPAPKKILDEEKVIAELSDLKFKKGYGNMAMVKHLKDKYKIGQTKAYLLINDMNTTIGVIYSEIYDDQLKDSLAFLEEMRAKAVSDDNIKLALEIQKELNKLNQLGTTQKIDVTSNGEQIKININLGD